MFPLLARVNGKTSPEEHALSSFDEVESQRIPEILDSIGGFLRFSVKNFFVHFCISDKVCSSVLDLIFLLHAL